MSLFRLTFLIVVMFALCVSMCVLLCIQLRFYNVRFFSAFTASGTVIDDTIKLITHRIFKTNWWKFVYKFLVILWHPNLIKKSILFDGFSLQFSENYVVATFWATLYFVQYMLLCLWWNRDYTNSCYHVIACCWNLFFSLSIFCILCIFVISCYSSLWIGTVTMTTESSVNTCA